MNQMQSPGSGASVDVQQQDMQGEIERLRASLKDAEHRIAELERQRDKYHEFTKLWIQQNCPISDWDDFDPAEYTESFDDLMAQIQAQFKV